MNLGHHHRACTTPSFPAPKLCARQADAWRRQDGFQSNLPDAIYLNDNMISHYNLKVIIRWKSKKCAP